MSTRHPTRAGAAGFTLIELLIVIAILGTLAVVLVPNIMGATDTANETATEATMMRIEEACKTFNREGHGYFPPDDFKSPEASEKVQFKSDNGQNTGIESLVAFCSQSRRDGMEMGDLKLVNGDKDQNGAELPLLKTKERLEIADAWGTPLVYFNKFGMEKTQIVVTPEDPTPMPVTAKKREDGVYFGGGKFQILSAGKDKIFGTADDLVWPKN